MKHPIFIPTRTQKRSANIISLIQLGSLQFRPSAGEASTQVMLRRCGRDSKLVQLSCCRRIVQCAPLRQRLKAGVAVSLPTASANNQSDLTLLQGWCCSFVVHHFHYQLVHLRHCGKEQKLVLLYRCARISPTTSEVATLRQRLKAGVATPLRAAFTDSYCCMRHCGRS